MIFEPTVTAWRSAGQKSFQLIDGSALSVGHYVIVGDDVALIRDDDARPK